MIGLELGSVYAALGTRVTVVEMLPGILPGADRDLVLPPRTHRRHRISRARRVRDGSIDVQVRITRHRIYPSALKPRVRASRHHERATHS